MGCDDINFVIGWFSDFDMDNVRYFYWMKVCEV